MAKRILVYDATSSYGGAMSSLEAFIPQLWARGWDVLLVGVVPAIRRVAEQLRSRSNGVLDSQLAVEIIGPGDFEDSSGFAYARRETRRGRSLSRLVRRFRPCVILANNGPQTNAAAFGIASFYGLPIVQWIRGAFYSSTLSELLLRNAEYVFCVGEEQYQTAVGLTPRPGAVRRIEEGLTPAQWSDAGPSRRPHWLWAGTTWRWKGMDVMLEAYRQLAAHRTTPLDICYIPVSAPSGAIDPETVEWPDGCLPHVDVADMTHFLGRTTVLVHTARRPEPFGRVVVEAMCSGVCPIVPDIGAPADFVQHEVSGLIYRAGDAAALARILRWAHAHPDGVSRLGQAAKQTARARFGADAAFRELCDALDRIAHQHHCAASRSMSYSLNFR